MANSVDSKRLFSYVFIFVLAVLFAVQWGPGSKGCTAGKDDATTQDVAATVNGKEIPVREFSQAYSNELSNFRAQGMTADLARQFGLPRQVIDRLVNFELLAQAAEARGISASDTEVVEQLKKNPNFHKEGRFDPDQYKTVLRDYFRMSPIAFEADLRRRMAAAKMLDLVESGAVVSEDEVKARYLKDGNKAKATFVRFTPAMFAAKVIAPKEPEVTAWAKAHEKEIADYYAANQLSYHQPERVRARQIVIRATKEDTEEKRNEAKQKIEGLKKQLVEGKDFAELAKQFSEDVETKEKGGDLGLVERISLPPTLATAVFDLKAGEVTAPIETPLGWHLAKVEEKKPPETRTLEMAKMEIATLLVTREKAKALAKAEAEKALTAMKAGKSLAELFPPSTDDSNKGSFRFNAETKPEAVDTGDFNTATASIPQLGSAPDALKAITDATAPGPLNQVYEVGDGFAVLSVDARARPSDTDFETQKQQMKVEAIKGKQFELREAFMKSLKQTGSVVVNDRVIDQVSQG
jgi:peptidyl-prolyl cis-trans isomerase D